MPVTTRPLPTAPPEPPASRHGWGWSRWAWRTLTSMRTAVILLALLALTAVPGSLLPQRNVATDPAAVPRFAADHTVLYPWLDRLSLFDVYASPWFAAVYVLLLVSMTGCVLPRCLRLWRSSRAAPVRAPRNLGRMEGHVRWTPTAAETTEAPDAVLARAAAALRRRRFRVRVDGLEVRAEKGYLREVGNLAFHLSLLVLLLGVAVGRLVGFEGRVALVEGQSFLNVVAAYDDFTPSVWTDTGSLQPFSFTLEDFEARFETSGSRSANPASSLPPSPTSSAANPRPRSRRCAPTSRST